MNRQRPDGSDFEQRLLARLRGVVAERGAAEAGSELAAPTRPRPRWRRPSRLVPAGVAALAVAVAILVFDSGSHSTTRAFAVEPQPGGGVTIKIYSLREAAGLEQALEDAGIPAQVTWLPAGMACREPHFTPSTVRLASGGTSGGLSFEGAGAALTIGAISTQQWQERFREHVHGETSDGKLHEAVPNLSFDPAQFGPDQSLVISGSPASPDDYVIAQSPYDSGTKGTVAVAEGPVEPCEPVPAPAEPGLTESASHR